jgi:hypothetical protein
MSLVDQTARVSAFVGIINEIEAVNQLPEDLFVKVSAIPEEGVATTSRSSAADLIRTLAETLCPSRVSIPGAAQRTWELVGLLYMRTGRVAEAIEAFRKLYDHILVGQDETNERHHKGMPLCWMSDCYAAMGYRVTAHRHLMLTLVEDAINGKGSVTFDTGAYLRLVWTGLLSEGELLRYGREAYAHYQSSCEDGLYPEWVLQQLDRAWITQVPAPQETGIFAPNLRYLDRLIGRLSDGTGRTLENLADYLLSCMPGCHAETRKRSRSTDYDVVCSVEGLETDFRSEFGRYFVCECKDLQGAASVTDIAKFCYVLDSVKSRFGIMFSTHGISGDESDRNADRERLKVFQNRGIVIVVIDKNDLDRLSKGANFVTLLRSKYEKIRLDLGGSSEGKEDN